MRTKFNDTPLVQYSDAIGIAHGRNAMRDKDGSSTLHDLAQVVEDLVFGMSIYAGEGVVEDEDAWTP